jgi:hypothetical protein
MESHDNEERFLLETIHLIKQEFDKAAKPYVDRLCVIRSMRQTQFTISVNQAIAAGVFKEPGKE